MLQRFDVLLIVLIVYFSDKLAGSRMPQPLFEIAIVIILIVLLLLGVVRY
ncbi:MULTISPECIES: hypothetical protein [unclassified Mesorhizobium]|nr:MULTISPECIES: hypothetical protein [unclassified Mesorhizobium]